MDFIIYSDLDGTLLDSETYSFENARPALSALAEHEIALVFCTSKTRAEVEYWRSRTDNRHPFITENGGALFVPEGYFPFPLPSDKSIDGYHAIEFGTRHAHLLQILHDAATETGCRISSFTNMSAEDIAVRTRLPLFQAQLAKQREYDEPFELLSGDWRKLCQAIESRGKRCLSGGRFHHIVGDNDMEGTVAFLTAAYKEINPNLKTIGLGDGPNDLEFLQRVDRPIVVQSRFSRELSSSIPEARVTKASGAEGWNEAVLEIMQGYRRPAMAAAAGRSVCENAFGVFA